MDEKIAHSKHVMHNRKGLGKMGRFVSKVMSNIPALLSKCGLTLSPPAEFRPDRRADLLPVLLLLDRHPLHGCQALLLNRQTGYLIGDLEQQQLDNEDGTNSSPPPNLGAFMIQPLWFGETSSGGAGRGGDQGGSGGSAGDGGVFVK